MMYEISIMDINYYSTISGKERKGKKYLYFITIFKIQLICVEILYILRVNMRILN